MITPAFEMDDDGVGSSPDGAPVREDDAIRFIFGEDVAVRTDDGGGSSFDGSLLELQVFMDVFSRACSPSAPMKAAGFTSSGGGRRFRWPRRHCFRAPALPRTNSFA